MCDELEQLKARCARLRAALAELVDITGDIDDPKTLDVELSVRSGPDFWDSSEEMAIKLLRETAEEVKT